MERKGNDKGSGGQEAINNIHQDCRHAKTIITIIIIGIGIGITFIIIIFIIINSLRNNENEAFDRPLKPRNHPYFHTSSRLSSD